ncbi:MAG: hydrogenase formation protein HypD, partial [Deltaproteobacteria bacterium]|nr:hydrogenase formation protein HypD [Deltaproteobacteria bacterium]
MKHVDEYRQPVLVKSLAARLQELAAAAGRRLRIMEVCGTHTMNLFRFGLRSLLPPTMEVVSGPGCPVCVTAPADIDACLTAAGNPRVTIATFGDLLRVPGSHGSLAAARSQGSRVVMVHSPATALDLARRHPEQLVVFIGIGFETTVPTVAATVKQAAVLGLDNFCLLSLHKIMPPVFARLLATGHRLDGLLYPGHVAAITGRLAFAGISETYALPGVIAGFEPVDIMQALVQL